MLSPCIGQCNLGASSEGVPFCTGCQRTLREIQGWATLSEESRRKICEELKERRF